MGSNPIPGFWATPPERLSAVAVMLGHVVGCLRTTARPRNRSSEPRRGSLEWDAIVRRTRSVRRCGRGRRWNGNVWRFFDGRGNRPSGTKGGCGRDVPSPDLSVHHPTDGADRTHPPERGRGGEPPRIDPAPSRTSRGRARFCASPPRRTPRDGVDSKTNPCRRAPWDPPTPHL